jgi:uncharacterized OB-fold protein
MTATATDAPIADMATAEEFPPQPLPDPDSQGFWQATADGRLALCRCQECHLWLQPPLERCRACGGATAFEPVSGRGRLYSFIVVHQPAVPGYRDKLPYIVGLVELAEQSGLRLPGRIEGVEASKLADGSPLRVEIVDHPGGPYRVPIFRPDDIG